MEILSGVRRRAFAIIVSPRAAFEAIAQSPRWVGILVATFLVSAGSTAAVLSTDVGQLALVDQWERTASAFGRDLNDAEYAQLSDASENWLGWAVMTACASGPLLVLGVSIVLFLSFRRAARTVTFAQVVAVVAHAGVILALRQLVAAPVAYAHETLANPVTLGLFFGTLDEASSLARFFGIVDLFVVWWVFVLAIGIAVLYQRPARRLAGVFVGAYVTLALVLAAVMAAAGGTA
jgi:hypothetical protein